MLSRRQAMIVVQRDDSTLTTRVRCAECHFCMPAIRWTRKDGGLCMANIGVVQGEKAIYHRCPHYVRESLRKERNGSVTIQCNRRFTV